MSNELTQKSFDHQLINQLSRQTLRWIYKQYSYKVGEKLLAEVNKIPEFLDLHNALTKQGKRLGLYHNNHIFSGGLLIHAWDFERNRPAPRTQFPDVHFRCFVDFPYDPILYKLQEDFDDVYGQFKRFAPFIHKYFGAVFMETAAYNLSVLTICGQTLSVELQNQIADTFNVDKEAFSDQQLEPAQQIFIDEFAKKHCKLMDEVNAHIFQGSFVT